MKPNLLTCALLTVFILQLQSCKTGNNRDISMRLDQDIDSLAQAFNSEYFTDTTSKSIGFSNLTEITETALDSIYGAPVFESVDTFEYGNRLTKYEPIDDNGYYDYDSDYRNIPHIVIHKFILSRGDTSAIILRSAENSRKQLIPISIYNGKYSHQWIPLWSLPECSLNLQQILKAKGLPTRESIDTVHFGSNKYFNRAEYIDALKDTPIEIIHKYEWDIDSSRICRIYFNEKDLTPQSKPIWGYICDIRQLLYE